MSLLVRIIHIVVVVLAGSYASPVAYREGGGRQTPPSENTAQALLDSARALNDAGKQVEAMPLFEYVLDLETKKWGRDHANTAGPKLGLASILDKKGDFEAAKNLYEHCLDITKPAFGPVHPSVIEASIGLGICLGNLGDYARAASVLQRRLDAVVESRGDHDPDAGMLMLRLADALDMLGKQVESTRLYRRAAEIIEEVYGPEHPRTAAALSGLAHVERRMGNSPEAAKLYRRCIDIVERNQGGSRSDLIHYRSRLGMCLFERQEFEQGMESVERAISEASEIYGSGSYQAALEKRQLGLILDYVNRQEEAYAILRSSLTTLESYFGPNHPYLSKCLKGLASTSFKRGAVDEAYVYISRAVSLQKNTAGGDRYELSVLLTQQAVYAIYLGRWEDAVENAAGATESALTVLENSYQDVSAREALLYAVRARASMANLVCAMAGYPDLPDSTMDRVFSLLVRTHGQVLDHMAERRRFLETSSDTTIVARKKSDFARAAQRVSDIAVRGPGDSLTAYLEALSRARREQEEAERALSAVSEQARLVGKSPAAAPDVPPADLAAVLPPGAVLVHFVYYSKWNESGSTPGDTRVPFYGVFRLEKTTTDSWDLRFLELGSVTELEPLVFAYRTVVEGVSPGRRPSAREEAEFRSVARRLYDKIWAPLKLNSVDPERTTEAPGGANTVFLVVDSWFSMLDFNTLIAPDGTLVIEHWKLHLLSSARDLRRVERAGPSGVGLLAVGNPTGAPVEPRAGLREGRQWTDSGEVLCAAAYRVPSSLPGAERETRSIAGVFVSETGEPAVVLVGEDGSEGAVKHSIKGKRVVHLAAHGFYCEEESKSILPVAERLVDPLLMSGLVLTAGPDDDDGLLTAQEVIGLDLRGVELVVLSACSSGLGRVFWGEGMVGLNRAFELAGARTVITALWRVNDAVTKLLMERIYQLRFEGYSTIDAVRRAQLELLQEQRRRLNRVHPVLWGGIVTQGDWR